MLYHGFVDRVVTDWAGPRNRVLRRKLRMLVPACADDVLTTSATVVAERTEQGQTVADVEVTVYTNNGAAATASIIVALG
jgi:acyl dehydratase